MAGDNRYGINLGAIYRDAAAIQGQRNTNQINSMKIDNQRRIESERPMREQQQRQQQQAMQGLRKQVVGGNEEARARYMAVDPEGAQQLIKMLDGEDDRAKQSATEQLSEIMKMSAYVMQAKNDPGEMESRYQRVKSSLPEETQATMPPNAEMGFLADNMRKAMGANEYIKSLEPKQKGDINQFDHGGQSILQQDGEIIDRAAIPEAASSQAPMSELDTLKVQELKGKIKERDQKIDKASFERDEQGSKMGSNLLSLQEFQSDLIALVSNDRAIDSLTGLNGLIPAVPGNSGWDANVLFDKVTNTNTLENMEKMTGVLTDADIKILRTAANGLEKGMTVKAFKNRLITIEKKINKAILTAAKKDKEYKLRMKQRQGAGVNNQTATQPAQVGTAKWGQR